MTTEVPTTTPTTTRSLVPLALGSCAVAIGWTAYGAHSWGELLSMAAFVALAGLLVFGFVVPRALRKESAGGTALALSVPALLLTLPAFWSGLPLVLGTAGMVLGNAGRTARTGAGQCIASLVVGALAVAGYLAIYIGDGVLAGHAGFLFD